MPKNNQRRETISPGLSGMTNLAEKVAEMNKDQSGHTTFDVRSGVQKDGAIAEHESISSFGSNSSI